MRLERVLDARLVPLREGRVLGAAGLDGLARNIPPPPPCDRTMYDPSDPLVAAAIRDAPPLPRSGLSPQRASGSGDGPAGAMVRRVSRTAGEMLDAMKARKSSTMILRSSGRSGVTCAPKRCSSWIGRGHRALHLQS